MTPPELRYEAAEKRLNVYIHIPFCIKKCSFCYIPVLPAQHVPWSNYLAALKLEASRRAPRFAAGGALVETLYLGGGTPSLLAPGLLAELVGHIRDLLPFGDSATLSMEVHPGPHGLALFQDHLAAGLNRLVICAQTFDSGRLARLGRTHTGEEAAACLKRARQTGFAHLGCELMWGYPDARPLDMAADFSRAVSEGATEVSFQWFNVNPKGFLPDPREQDRLWTMFSLMKEAAVRLGFRQVGAQSFAAAGAAHRHHAINGPGLATTPYGKVLGLGWGAMSHLGGCMESHSGSMDRYLQDPGAGHLAQSIPSDELVWGAFTYGLTVLRSVPGAWMEGPFRQAANGSMLATTEAWQEAGLIQADPQGGMVLTLRGEALLDAYLHASGTSNRGGANPLGPPGGGPDSLPCPG